MSQPIKWGRCLLSIVLFSILSITLLANVSSATITISNINEGSNQIQQGTTGNVVLSFNLSITGETVDRITIKNVGPGALFGASNISRVAIYTSIAPLGGLQGEVFPADGAAQSQQIPVSIAAPGATYYVIYDVSSKAGATEEGVADIYASVELESVRGTTSGTQTPTSSIVKSIKVLPSGLSYDSSRVQFLAPPNNVGPGVQNASIMSMRLRANSQYVTVNYITVRSGDGVTYPGNFAPSLGLLESYIKKVSIYADNGNEYWDGVGGADTLVGTINLGITNTQYEARVTISPTGVINPFYAPAHADKKTRMFFVLYDVGSAVSPGVVVRAELADAGGTGSSASVVQLNGVLPTSKNISLTIANVNLQLQSVTDNVPTSPPAYYAVAGERSIPQIIFTLNNSSGTSFTNATMTIRNPAATFLSSGEGVSKVLIRRQEAGSTNFTLVGATTTFRSNTTAEVSGISIPQGSSTFRVEYDVSLGAPGNTIINCQLENVAGSGIVFGGNVPAPIPSAGFMVTTTVLQVLQVSESVHTVKTSDSFPLQIAVRHVHPGVGAVMKVNTVRPVMYYQNVSGRDISPEYSATILSSEDSGGTSIPPNYYITLNTTVTYNFSVRATNLKTNGPVFVDAYVDYLDNSQIGLKVQSIVLSRYLSSGSYSAAVVAGGRTGAFVASGGDSIPAFSLKLPAYIIGMTVVPYSLLSPVAFMNGDTIARNSKLTITLANNGDFFDGDTLAITLGGVSLAKGTDYTYSNGVITINDVGQSSGTFTINGYSGTTPIETATIKFFIDTTFTIRDFFAGPSPYRPSQGSLYFSYQLSEEASVKIMVYDSAGQLIWSQKEISGIMGYNEYAWDGVLDVGGSLGRGVYMVYITARSTRTDKEKTEKTKFAVF